MSAYVVVQLAIAGHATRTRGAQDPLAQQKVKRLLTEHGAEVLPSSETEAGGEEPRLSATIAVSDMACADKLAAALRELEGIETAYAKPGEELP